MEDQQSQENLSLRRGANELDIEHNIQMTEEEIAKEKKEKRKLQKKLSMQKARDKNRDITLLQIYGVVNRAGFQNAKSLADWYYEEFYDCLKALGIFDSFSYNLLTPKTKQVKKQVVDDDAIEEENQSLQVNQIFGDNEDQVSNPMFEQEEEGDDASATVTIVQDVDVNPTLQENEKELLQVMGIDMNNFADYKQSIFFWGAFRLPRSHRMGKEQLLEKLQVLITKFEIDNFGGPRMVAFAQNNDFKGASGFKKMVGMYKFNSFHYNYNGNLNYARLSTAELKQLQDDKKAEAMQNENKVYLDNVKRVVDNGYAQIEKFYHAGLSHQQLFEKCKHEGRVPSEIPYIIQAWRFANTAELDLMTITDDKLNELLKAKLICYKDLQALNHARKWSQNKDAYKDLKDVRYGHKKLIIICGLSRTGKSAAADAIFGESIYHKVGEFDDRWFDNYNPLVHDAILLQDINVTPDSGRLLLRLADHYPIWGEIKGDSIFMNLKFVVVTSQQDSLEETFAKSDSLGESESLNALRERAIVIQAKQGDTMESIADRVVNAMQQSVIDSSIKSHEHNMARERIRTKYSDFSTWFRETKAKGDITLLSQKQVTKNVKLPSIYQATDVSQQGEFSFMKNIDVDINVNQYPTQDDTSMQFF